jgi:hypothetical protein
MSGDFFAEKRRRASPGTLKHMFFIVRVKVGQDNVPPRVVEGILSDWITPIISRKELRIDWQSARVLFALQKFDVDECRELEPGGATKPRLRSGKRPIARGMKPKKR